MELWDGSPIQTYTNFSNVLSHTFSYYGNNDTTYTITLVGKNSCGSDTLKKTFTVYPNSVNAFFNIDTLSGCAPLTINFTNYSSGSTSYLWEFGDGNTSTISSPHMFILHLVNI